MVIQILTSVEDNFAYGYNLGYLRRAIQRREVHLDGQPYNHHPAPQTFTKRSVYFFTRTAKATIRDNIVKELSRPDVLPELQREGEQKLKKIFGRLFNNDTYKDELKVIGSSQEESMNMLIFNDRNGQDDQGRYAAHVSFLCISRKTGSDMYEVEVTLSCQRVTYFEKQDEDFEAFLQALDNLYT